MNKFESVNNPLTWFMAILMSAIMAGCGGGSGASSMSDAIGTPGAPVGPPATSPLLVAPSLNTYALTTSAGLATSIGTAAGVANSATFGGDVAMDAPVSTCTSTPAAAASGVAAVAVGTEAVDSCGLEVGLIDTTNAPINIPGGLKITGSTIRYFAANSNTFNATVRAVKNRPAYRVVRCLAANWRYSDSWARRAGRPDPGAWYL